MNRERGQRVKRGHGITVFLIALGGCQGAPPPVTGGPDVEATAGQTYKVNFDTTPPGPITGGALLPVGGIWFATVDDTAPSPPHSLLQQGTFGPSDTPRMLLVGYVFHDHNATVSCNTKTGKTARVCGLMFHVSDSDNYFLARANALDKSVALYRVVGGVRQMLKSSVVDYTNGIWHTLTVTTRLDTITVSWDGAQTLTTLDGSYPSGKLGILTEADSVTAFDDLSGKSE